MYQKEVTKIFISIGLQVWERGHDYVSVPKMLAFLTRLILVINTHRSQCSGFISS